MKHSYDRQLYSIPVITSTQTLFDTYNSFFDLYKLVYQQVIQFKSSLNYRPSSMEQLIANPTLLS